MVNPDKMFGRLSNRMFIMAAWYAHCRDNNIHFFAQDEKYFKKYEQEIRNMYSEGIGPVIDRVSIHVRKGKNPINPQEPAYNENPFYANLTHHLHEDMSDSYYARAMALFPGEKFLIFSDDIEWCREQELFKDCEFSGNTSDIDDLNMMASCKHNIIANSSFSWWAAYLNPNPNKVIIAPKQWFSNPDDEQYVGIPETWKRL